MKVNTNAPSHPSIAQETAVDKTKAKGNSLASPLTRTETGASSEGTSVEISERAQLLKTANEIVHQTPDVRKDRVESLKRQIAEGSYRVDADKLAERILEDHLGTDFGKNNL